MGYLDFDLIEIDFQFVNNINKLFKTIRKN